MRGVQDPNDKFVERGRSYRLQCLVDPFVDLPETAQLDGELEPFERRITLQIQRVFCGPQTVRSQCTLRWRDLAYCPSHPVATSTLLMPQYGHRSQG